MSKITDYGALTAPASGDELVIVDVSDTTMAASGTTKKIAVSDLMTAIVPSDVPQLSQYNPIGLTGATAPTSYAGGTVSGHPLSGTWSKGEWVVDQQGHIFVCVTGGTPGTWRRVGKDPWQFFLDDYCKGDGLQALVTVSNGSATINTTPLSAPSAPSLSTATTGGTIAAGTYQAVVTYTNRWGETVGSASASITTTGSTSTITATSPTPTGNATGWNLYLTQAGGGTYTLQQAVGSPTLIEVGLTLSAPPTSTGATPPAVNTSAAQVFNAATDVNKNIMICGALGSPGAPWIDTISQVNSPTQAVLSTAGATVSQAGCAMVFSSDDRLNIDQCILDAKAYALANGNFAQVIGSDKIYGTGTGLFQSLPSTAGGPGLQYNTQVRIPSANQSGQKEKLEFQLLGPGENTHAGFWVSQYVNLSGCTFVSYSVGPLTPDSTYGQQSIISGPIGGTNYNGSNAFANLKAVIKGIQVIQPGFSNSIGIDLKYTAGCFIRASSNAFAPATNSGGGINPSNAWISNTFFQAKIGIGLRLPTGANNDDVVVESFATEGITTGVVTAADHVIINRLVTINEHIGVQCDGNLNSHALTINQWSFENVNGGLLTTAGSGPCMVNITMDGENSSISYDVKDPNNVLTGVIHWRDTFRSPSIPTNIGVGSVKFYNDSLGPGHWSGAPAVPATTVAQQNTAWRNASIVVHTGAGVTVSAITIDGTVTGLTMAASSSLTLPVLPGGKSVTLTFAGGTPTWDWWLD